MNHFIKLPDGTIINVAHVRKVSYDEHPERCYRNGDPVFQTVIDTGGGVYKFDDGSGVIGGTIYAYFESIAQEIGKGKS